MSYSDFNISPVPANAQLHFKQSDTTNPASAPSFFTQDSRWVFLAKTIASTATATVLTAPTSQEGEHFVYAVTNFKAHTWRPILIGALLSLSIVAIPLVVLAHLTFRQHQKQLLEQINSFGHKEENPSNLQKTAAALVQGDVNKFYAQKEAAETHLKKTLLREDQQQYFANHPEKWALFKKKCLPGFNHLLEQKISQDVATQEFEIEKIMTGSLQKDFCISITQKHLNEERAMDGNDDIKTHLENALEPYTFKVNDYRYTLVSARSPTRAVLEEKLHWDKQFHAAKKPPATLFYPDTMLLGPLAGSLFHLKHDYFLYVSEDPPLAHVPKQDADTQTPGAGKLSLNSLPQYKLLHNQNAIFGELATFLNASPNLDHAPSLPKSAPFGPALKNSILLDVAFSRERLVGLTEQTLTQSWEAELLRLTQMAPKTADGFMQVALLWELYSSNENNKTQINQENQQILQEELNDFIKREVVPPSTKL